MTNISQHFFPLVSLITPEFSIKYREHLLWLYEHSCGDGCCFSGDLKITVKGKKQNKKPTYYLDRYVEVEAT